MTDIRETSRDLRFSAGGWGAGTMMLVPAGTPVEVLCELDYEHGSAVLVRLEGGESRVFPLENLVQPEKQT